ncbi:hypothetical protein [Streptomyces sp. NPDC049881]|uniref:hypothetical protein n=1 Tax=Streptomyces sp. NPDC049881 TaxID=3155778 RepID=UPI0034324515
MTGWSWAEISGDGGSTNYDRRQADRRSRALAPRPNGNDHSDHYAAKAEARERAERNEQLAHEWERSHKEWSNRDEIKRRFAANDPEPWPFGLPGPNDPDHDIFEASAEQQAWEKRRDEYLARAEGEQLAAQISRH